MQKSRIVPLSLIFAVVALLPVPARAQSFNGSISGTVKDPSGAIVGGAELVLKNQVAGIDLRRTATDKGEYAFRNLVPGSYELRVSAAGFKPHIQKNVEVNLNADVRVDLSLALGEQTDQVEVVAETSTLNYDNGAHEDGISPAIRNSGRRCGTERRVERPALFIAGDSFVGRDSFVARFSFVG